MKVRPTQSRERVKGRLPSPGAVLTPLAKEIMEGKK